MDAAYEHAAKSYYSADEQLVVHQITRDSADHTPVWPDTVTYGKPWGVYEEYWYDALGRRVLKRSRQDSPICTHLDRCYSSITRFVWDGDQILWELRQSGSGNTKNPTGVPYTGKTGNIGYVHAGGIDAPLGMVRNGNGVVLHRNWRGLYQTATKATNGDEIGSSDVPWPGVSWSTTQTFQDTRETHTWVGSLSMGQQDHTGLNYRRNRYYDPSSGQFTQQDPIGIAGGLNLYGYANGDPINFSDPFGLCPEGVPITECPDAVGGVEPAMGPLEAAGMLFGGGVAIKALASRVAGRILGRFLAKKVSANITPKIARQMGPRGWTDESLEQVLNSPHATRPATNRATGNRATAYFRDDGSYVVRDNVTDDIVQVSNRHDPDWIPDESILDPFIPE